MQTTTESKPATAPPERLVLMRFRPMWKHIDGVREFCGFFTRTTFENRELGDRVGLVIHELVENAIKYSERSDDAELEVAIRHVARSIEISVSNHPRPADLARLRGAFELMRGQDAGAAYVSAMRRAAALPQVESGLGLTRIRFEARMDLTLETTKGRACVVARGEV